MTARKKKNQGMNWIAQATRLAIYLRDGFACAYCGEGIETGNQLTLDHLKPYSKGGDNSPTNLVTCCHRCNSARGNRAVRTFCKAVASYINHGATAQEIENHIRATSKRSLKKCRIEAKELIARRGTVARVLNHM